MKITLERQIQLAFFLSLILLLTLGFFGYRSAAALNEALEWEKHTQDVYFQLDETLILVLNAETGGRGFVITGDEVFFEPYKRTEKEISDNLTRLRELVSNNPEQIAEITTLENLIRQKLVFTEDVSNVRRREGFQPALARIANGEGRRLMDEVRLSISRMREEEKTLFEQRENDLNKSIGNTLFILFFATSAGIVSLGLANFAIYRETGKRAKAEDDLRETNKNLENLVQERTKKLLQKNEELNEQIVRREESENQRTTALEAGGLGTWRLNLDGEDGEMDERSLSLFGLSKENFNGSSKIAFSRIVEEDAPGVDEEFRRAITEKRNFNAEFRIRDSEGSIRWNNCTGKPQFDENGDVLHLVGFCRDITENKKFEEARRRNEEFVRAILDSLPAHIAVVDKTGTIVGVNRAWREFAETNCLEHEIASTGVGQNYLNVCEKSDPFDEDAKKICENLRKVLSGEMENFVLEYPCHLPSEERWFIMQVSAMSDGAVISHINITDRKQVEISLKRSEEFNRSVFENSPDCVKVLDLKGRIHAINTNGVKMMDVEYSAAIIGKNWLDLWENEESEVAYQALETARKGKTANFEGFCETAKGSPKWWSVSVAPVLDGTGETVRLIATSRDITERREAEREREELLKRERSARKEAEVANRLRDEFLATVSHELRAPLNSILGWARLLEKGKLDETTSEKAFNTIVRNAEAQNRLIEDLLDVSRIISGKLRLEVMTVKPIIFVEDALETVRPAAQAKNIALEINEESDVSHISGDPNRLQQVVWNLLSNAIKFTPNGGKVSVDIVRENGTVEIRVRDTGVGIKPEFLPYVFDRFSQADASSIRKFGGLGLGLAIVRHITEMHGGTVHVTSEGENQGSIFSVKLPVSSTAPKREDAEIIVDESLILDGDSKLKLDGLLILAVDDEADTRQLLVQALTHYGATVITASSVEKALIELQEKNPDVVVSDIGMPDEDGYSLIRKVRALSDKQHKNIPAIALTAFTRAQDRMRALTSGYQNHVAKPVEPDELATVIASLTGRLRIENGDN